MTVAELIAQLQKYDPNMRVVVNEYETGYTELDKVLTISAHQWVPARKGGNFASSDDEREGYEGEFQQDYADLPTEEFVWLPRKYRL
jgi:hypothetical protein